MFTGREREGEKKLNGTRGKKDLSSAILYRPTVVGKLFTSKKTGILKNLQNSGLTKRMKKIA